VKYLTRVKEFCSCLLSICLYTLLYFSADHPRRKTTKTKEGITGEEKRRKKKRPEKEKPADTQNSTTEKATEKNSLPAAEIRARKSPSITFIRSGYVIR